MDVEKTEQLVRETHTIEVVEEIAQGCFVTLKTVYQSVEIKKEVNEGGSNE